MLYSQAYYPPKNIMSNKWPDWSGTTKGRENVTSQRWQYSGITMAPSASLPADGTSYFPAPKTSGPMLHMSASLVSRERQKFLKQEIWALSSYVAFLFTPPIYHSRASSSSSSSSSSWGPSAYCSECTATLGLLRSPNISFSTPTIALHLVWRGKGPLLRLS